MKKFKKPKPDVYNGVNPFQEIQDRVEREKQAVSGFVIVKLYSLAPFQENVLNNTQLHSSFLSLLILYLC